MAKLDKSSKKKPGKLHVEIPRANWARLEAFLKAFNEDPGRLTPKIKPAHVINQALLHYLSGRAV